MERSARSSAAATGVPVPSVRASSPGSSPPRPGQAAGPALPSAALRVDMLRPPAATSTSRLRAQERAAPTLNSSMGRRCIYTISTKDPSKHNVKCDPPGAPAQVMACGSRPCAPLSFCHEASNTCKPCAAICDPARPGQYEPGLCLENCREYTEQLRSASAVDGTARVLGAVGLALGVLSLVAVIVLAGLLLFYVYRRPRRLLQFLQNRVDVETPEMKAKMSMNNNKSCGADIGRDLNSSVCTVSGSVSEADLRLHHHHAGAGAMPQQPTLALPPLATLSPAPPPLPPARHPSEDSTLDYAAYDNPALSPSSSPLPPGAGGGKAMDAVLDAVMDHNSLPGTVTRGQLLNGMANGAVARMESSF
ncbi:Fat-like cadherin-related tumor suppressor-like protein [Frankliniella fusca]|uniref:Fat-like cadherin-related tumor suppressor-like protein n=1 Tax=Frankliniella fusca TaxID=407009 RepID=A0AAE1GUZ5_9NEOP|nr:Fat-like cadherin-related tumor suppressor-like protein [Frankliniella fusca]